MWLVNIHISILCNKLACVEFFVKPIIHQKLVANMYSSAWIQVSSCFVNPSSAKSSW